MFVGCSQAAGLHLCSCTYRLSQAEQARMVLPTICHLARMLSDRNVILKDTKLVLRAQGQSGEHCGACKLSLYSLVTPEKKYSP
jgi:hypothetical protein